jgi:acylphosphatase
MDIRKHVYYSGTVQGVGFRYAARNVARGHRVTGFVKNLRDGRVEVVVEGEMAEVQGFLDDVAGAMHGYAARAQASDEPATGKFAGFGVSFDE